jgi:hypothetical protein
VYANYWNTQFASARDRVRRTLVALCWPVCARHGRRGPSFSHARRRRIYACKGFGSNRFRSRPAPGIREWIESDQTSAEELQKGRAPIDPRFPSGRSYAPLAAADRRRRYPVANQIEPAPPSQQGAVISPTPNRVAAATAQQRDGAASSTPRRGSLTAQCGFVIHAAQCGFVLHTARRVLHQFSVFSCAACPPSVFSVPSVCLIVRAFCICMNSVFNSVVRDMYV